MFLRYVVVIANNTLLTLWSSTEFMAWNTVFATKIENNEKNAYTVTHRSLAK